MASAGAPSPVADRAASARESRIGIEKNLQVGVGKNLRPNIAPSITTRHRMPISRCRATIHSRTLCTRARGPLRYIALADARRRHPSC